MRPDSHPTFGLLLADWLAAQPHDKPTAGGTRFRHSDAGKCARALSFTAAGFEPTNPASPSGLWVMNLGTYGHEVIQQAITEAYPEAVCEIVCVWENGFDGSGHADVLVRVDGRLVLIEVKTMGAYGWDLAVGINRKARKLTEPQGPRSSALIQGALNALPLDADDLCLILLSMESVSDSLAKQLGLSDVERFARQWTFPREVWEPWAIGEQARVSKVLAHVSEGNLAERVAIGDDFAPKRLTPGGRDWNCDYCAFRDVCEVAGDGVVPIESVRRKVAA